MVTADVAAGSIATGDRMVVLHDAASAGQSAAAEIGIRYAVDEGYERVLLVPGDTPLLKPPDLDDMLARCERDGVAVAIVPDRHGTGTNGLLITPPDAFRPRFGEGSFERHLTQAQENELVYRIEKLPSLEHDVDTPGDLAALWDVVSTSERGAQRTRGALAQLGRAGTRATGAGAAVEA